MEKEVIATATKEDPRRVLALEDMLFNVALKFHLLSRHSGYFFVCDARECVDSRALLGNGIFMVKYGDALPISEGGK